MNYGYATASVLILPKNTPKEAAGYLLIAYCTVRYHPSGLMVHRSVFRDIGLFDTRLPLCED